MSKYIDGSQRTVDVQKVTSRLSGSQQITTKHSIFYGIIIAPKEKTCAFTVYNGTSANDTPITFDPVDVPSTDKYFLLECDPPILTKSGIYVDINQTTPDFQVLYDDE